MTDEISMRDAFINKLYELAKYDKNVIIVDADMGALTLDRFRTDFSKQFINVGIAEQNMIAIASGLALEGKKAFTYCIAPFGSSRCHEFIKLNAGLMKIPIKILVVGAGFGYDDSGPTHHTTEDIAIIRAIPNIEIFSPSDSQMAASIAEIAYKSENPMYIRLDRKILPDLSKYHSYSLEQGFKEIVEGQDIAIIATGIMVHKALEVREELMKKGKNIGVIDLYKIKPINAALIDVLRKYKIIVSLEEHLINGGLGSILSEIITDNSLPLKLNRIGLRDYYYLYKRDNIHKKLGLDVFSVIKKIENILRV